MMRDGREILIAISLGLLGSCQMGITRSELPGRYRVQYPYGVEELELQSNGVYVQTIKLNREDAPATNTGRWEYQEGSVLLTDPLLVDDNFGKPRADYRIRQRGGWYLRVERGLGGITLNWADDLGFHFRKIASNQTTANPVRSPKCGPGLTDAEVIASGKRALRVMWGQEPDLTRYRVSSRRKGRVTLVEQKGFEPSTPTLRTWCSPG
jgi:hypothetical protein